jgi:hypothetical protein
VDRTGIILAFTIPRAPGVVYNKDTPLGDTPYADDEPQFSSGIPVYFRFNATLDMNINTGENFLPLRFNHLRAEVQELDTSQLIATGDLGSYVLPAKAYERVHVPVFFNYTAANNTDQTWANVYNACRNSNQYPDRIRPGMYTVTNCLSLSDAYLRFESSCCIVYGHCWPCHSPCAVERTHERAMPIRTPLQRILNYFPHSGRSLENFTDFTLC